MNQCKEYLKHYREVVRAKKEDKIDKRYKPYLAPNNKYYTAHCGYCAEVNYLEEEYKSRYCKEEIKEGYFGEELDDDVYASREVREAADKSAKEKNPT